MQFGKYRLSKHLARGGMGDVYLASLSGEFGFHKQLVVKLIRPELATDPRFVTLFAAEAKTAVTLEHPNIVPIYELGRSETNVLYIAMGRVDGPSVATYLRLVAEQQRPPDVAAALYLIREILEGLAYAHRPAVGRSGDSTPGRKAVVHRDVSTGNVLLDRSGRVLLVDFGIALPAETKVDGRMGSSGYIAPEQARAAEADPRADIFSVGCIFYELLTHARAFPNEGMWAPPEMAAVPDFVRPLLCRMLHVDPGARPADGGAALREVGSLLARHAPTFGSQDLADRLQDILATTDACSNGSAPPTTRDPTAVTKVTTPFATRRPSTKTATEFDSMSSAAMVFPTKVGHRLRSIALAALAALGIAVVLSFQPSTLSSPDARSRTSQPPANPRRKPTSRETDPPRSPPRSPSGTSPVPAVRDRHDPARRRIDISPRRARPKIWLNDHALPGPPFNVDRPALDSDVTLRIRVEAPGYAHEIATFSHADFEATEANPKGKLRISLRRLAAGSITVTAPGVAWAEVWIDGKKAGQTPLLHRKTEAGPHQLRVRCPASVCQQQQILLKKNLEVRPGKELKVVAQDP